MPRVVLEGSLLVTFTLGDIAFPVTDTAGNAVGVIAAHLTWQRSPNHAQRLTDEVNTRLTTRAYVLDRSGLVLIGPDGIRGTRQFQIARRPAGHGQLRRRVLYVLLANRLNRDCISTE